MRAESSKSLKIGDFERIVVLTGAGVSAESGISTFRDSGGLWEKHRIEDVATPEAFERDPVLVWRFYELRRQNAFSAQPNAAHRALARFAASCGQGKPRPSGKPGASQASGKSAGTQAFQLVTQNVDFLHERAALEAQAPFPWSMHGTLAQTRCRACGRIYWDNPFFPNSSDSAGPGPKTDLLLLDRTKLERDRRGLPLAPCCGDLLRPHIVWFGEMPLHLDEIQNAVEACDLFVSIGTSGNVYPAAGYIEIARDCGATTVCLNPEEIPQRGSVDHFIPGRAGEVVPRFFQKESDSF